MNKLLRAGFRRLWRDRVFQILMVLALAFGLFVSISKYVQMNKYDLALPVEGSMMVYVVFMIFISAVFTSLFIGTEYNDGTIRNKIIVGHRRSVLYISNLIVCVSAVLMMCGVFLIGYLGAGIPLLGTFRTVGIKTAAIYILVSAVLTASTTAIYVTMASLCSSKAHSAVLCMLLAMVFLMGGSYIAARLDAPEYYDGYELAEDGEIITVAPEPNPQYLRGTSRQIFEFLFDFTPGSQALQVGQWYAEEPGIFVLYDILILLVSSGAGIILFKRKDLK